MKKILFISLLSFHHYCVNAQAYTYHPMPDSNAVWRVDYGWVLCYPVNSTYQYLTKGDTTIANNPYTKIYISGIFDCLSSWGSFYRGGLRNDTINKKVYFIEKDSTNEKLLYDFSLNVGDTVYGVELGSNSLYMWGSGPSFGFDLISSIDSVLIGSNYHRRFNLIYQPGYIEGVGSYQGLLELYYDHFESSYSLVCFSHNSNLYPDAITSCNLIDSTLLNIKNQNQNYEGITLSPNPVNTESSLKLTDEADLINLLEIYNSQGKKIKEKKNVNTIKFQINKTEFKSGIYIANIITKKRKRYSMKFIVL